MTFPRLGHDGSTETNSIVRKTACVDFDYLPASVIFPMGSAIEDTSDVISQTLADLRTRHESTTQQFQAWQNKAQSPSTHQDAANSNIQTTLSSTTVDKTAPPEERRIDRIRTMLDSLSPSVVTAAMRRGSPSSGVAKVIRGRSPSKHSAIRARLGFMDTPTMASQQGAPFPQSPKQADPQEVLFPDGFFDNAASSNPPRSPTAGRATTSTAGPSPPMSAEFRFGGQQVYVSGPPMYQQLHLYPDGSLSTLHTPREIYSPRLVKCLAVSPFLLATSSPLTRGFPFLPQARV